MKKTIKYVIQFLIMSMKSSTTIRQISSTIPARSYSTSRIRQNEIFEDYSQVRVYYIQGFFYIEIKKQQSSLITFVILAFFFFVLAQNSIPFPSLFVCYSS